jgi:uncharacterized protein YndB with AHSA1/START domain
MDIEMERIFGAVGREVSSRELEGRTIRVAKVTRTYETDSADLWDAITNGERIPRWFLPISGELRLGGRYQLEGNAGGMIITCEPPRHLEATWEYGGDVSWVTVEIEPEGEGRARLTMEHVAYVDDDRWKQFGPGAVGVGWDLALIGLDLYLSSGQAVDPMAFEAWNLSDPGKRFVRLASDDWARASIASGTPREEALEAAAQTTAFYTGDEVDAPGSSES